VAASTIHTRKYTAKRPAPRERLNFQRQPNRAEQTLYIVDRGSMISTKSLGEKRLA
jgi:hypothetical protein